MKCPHCSQNIGILSKAVNKFGKDKFCPHCEQPIAIYVSWQMAGLLFIPAMVLTLLLRPVVVSFGISGSLANGLVTGALVLSSLRLKVRQIASK
jgi:hypothetical protein